MPEERRHPPGSAAVEHVEARRAATGSDLWPAIEAAQYARVILCAQPRSEDESETMGEFVDDFTRWVETWEGLSPGDQATILVSLGRWLDVLGHHDLHVHWGVTERTIDGSTDDADAIPLAVVVVDGSGSPTATVTVPLDLEIEGPDENEEE